MTGESQEAPAKPFLRVVSGNPTPEELAALVTVIAASVNSSSEEDVDPGITWGSPSNMHRTPIAAPGPGTWQQLGRR